MFTGKSPDPRAAARKKPERNAAHGPVGRRVVQRERRLSVLRPATAHEAKTISNGIHLSPIGVAAIWRSSTMRSSRCRQIKNNRASRGHLPQRTNSWKRPSLSVDLSDYRRNFQIRLQVYHANRSPTPRAASWKRCWRKTPLTAEQIFAAVGPENGWAPATVKTLVTRLLKKKAISGAKEADAYCYRPLIPARASGCSRRAGACSTSLFKGEVAPLVAHFAEHRQLSAKDLETAQGPDC